jgi:hypothetical protein
MCVRILYQGKTLRRYTDFIGEEQGGAYTMVESAVHSVCEHHEVCERQQGE